MLDFLMICERITKTGIEVYPKFKIMPSSDLMIRGGDFYSIWIEGQSRWSLKEQDALDLIDMELRNHVKANEHLREARVLSMWDSDSGSIDRWHKFVQKQCRDNWHQLDDRLIFSNMEVKKTDYSSHRLDYPLEKGSCEAWGKIIGTLYSESERLKIEWAIGSIVTGESRYIQKFLVLYGAPGAGKGTILKIIERLFEGYLTAFNAKAIGSSSNQFALEAFRANPLVAIQQDGDLSRIEDNTLLNSLVSHEVMSVNEKYAKAYSNSFHSFLFMGTNKPVKITDSRSGLLRRLIDVQPTGEKIPLKEYNKLMKQIPFELGAIAYHCKEVYENHPEAFDDYIPVRMLGATNDFFNFLTDSYPVFKKQNGTTLKAAWEMYKTWVDEAKVTYPYTLRIFKEELKDYFWEFEEQFDSGEATVKNYYHGFKTEKFIDQSVRKEKPPETSDTWIIFRDQPSLLDDELSNLPAQYAGSDGTPSAKWENVKTTLKDINSKRLHYVRVPMTHIVIDFDIPDADGNKSLEKNMEAASKFPPTYAELSKSGCGIHLHYLYSGDPERLNRVYGDHIEIKVFTGLSSLRRKLTLCNDIPVATISSGLPLKGEKAMVNFEGVQSEKGLRTTIKKCLQKEIHADTTSNVSMILKALDDAYNSGMHYDVSDLYGAVLAFAANSTHQSDNCLKMVGKMQFKSDEPSENVEQEAPIVFYDVEVFQNLFLVNWKFIEPKTEKFEDILAAIIESRTKPVTRMYNPTPEEIEGLLKYRLIGFNCRRYDNHMLYACLVGYSTLDIYKLSQNIINNGNGFFKEAYNLSYTDVYDFASAGNKKSLKKLEIDMGVHHQELGLPWDQPVPEDKWELVGKYCDNDVNSTEAAFWFLEADWIARQILADLADLTVNDTTNQLTTKIIFGNEKKPQSQFCYRNLAEQVTELPEAVSMFLWDACPEMMDWWSKTDSLLPYFPGYTFENGKSLYFGEEVGEGGRVYAEPGMYYWDALLDIASMHPHSTIAECLFGPEFTRRFKEIVDGRVSIKHEAWEEINNILGGKLTKYIQWVKDGKFTAKQLANALKTAINSVYGLTAAKFSNPFKDPRNIDNIVAKRGALFMMNLEREVKQRGYTVAHIKTDSIKIPMADKKIIKFVMEYGKRYGYTFEHEATYERMCLVNDAVYIARYASAEDCEALYGYVPDDNKKKGGKWTATGKQFQVSYVFKKLFSHEDITFDDMCETMSVSSALYLREQDSDNPEFIGRVGQFCPIKEGCGGKELLRESKDADGNVKYSAATGSKGYFWLESETVKNLKMEDLIDRSYYDDMVNKAVETISQYGDFDAFVDISMKPEKRHEEHHDYESCQNWKKMREEDPSKECFDCPYFHVADSVLDDDICEIGFDVSGLLPF